MYRYSKRSKSNLSTCHFDIQAVMNQAIKIIDLTILCGRRNREDQEKAFKLGRSEVQWPNSKHNVTNPKSLSDAVDMAPWPINWKKKWRFGYAAGIIVGIGFMMGVKLRWGGLFKKKSGKPFFDGPHIELDKRGERE